MDLIELLKLIWRWKLVVVAVTIVVIGAAYGVLQLVTPLYESETTLVIEPVEEDPDFFLFSNIDSITPVYADAATSQTTVTAAENQLGRAVDEVTIDTIQGTPLLKLHARDSDPAEAQRSAQAVTDALLARVDSGEIGVASLTLSQLDRASLPGEAAYPRERLTLLVAGVLGLFLGVGAAFLGEALGARVSTVEGAEEVLGIPCFAEIPTDPALSHVFLPDALGVDVRLRRLHEALRDLRTNLQLEDDRFHSILVTSPDGRHGKSTISTGLALTIAQSGKRTLLIDADLRRGRVSELVGLPPTAGLVEALHGAPLAELVRPTKAPELHVLTRGAVVDDPGDLLRSYPSVLRQIRERYEVVVVDTTPVAPVNDARILASFTDAVLLVVSAETATRRKLRAAMSRLELLSVRPVAFVLNRSRSRSGSDYYATIPERNMSQLGQAART
jgi:capsular exopolysaccharide synthesis family protein